MMNDAAAHGHAQTSVSPHPLFDAEWYRRENPDIPGGQASFSHYLHEGWRQLRSPHPLFSVEFYLRNRADIRAAGVEPLAHFVTEGWREGSNPHPLFDVAFYLSQGPSLDGLDPLTHYVTIGWKQGLKPNARFDPQTYLEHYSDVREAEKEPLTHFLMYGIRENRRYSCVDDFGSIPAESEILFRLENENEGREQTPEPEQQAETPGASKAPDEETPFDEEMYLLCNPDVAEAINAGDVENALDHWLKVGLAEGRGESPGICRDELYADAIAPQELDLELATRDFDACEYSIIYRDVAEAYNHDLEACRQHWITDGRKEGRFGPGVRLFSNRKASVESVLQKPFGINIYGPFAAVSGLGVAARNLAAAIRSSKIPYELHIFDVSRGLPRITRDEAQRAGTYRVNLILANADQIQNFVRLYPANHFDNYYNIAEWAWELAAFRPDWFGCFGAVDEVWAYSPFAVEAIEAIAPVPVCKAPLPIVAERFAPDVARERFAIPRDTFVFLTLFDVGSTFARKNPMAVVKAFREAFRDVHDAFLVVKFHSPGSCDSSLIRELAGALSGLDNAVLISDRLSEEEMAMLRAASDCLVSAHRSEGYGLNIAEFMALGKAVVATNYSGNLEFFSEEFGYPVDYRLVEIEEQAGPYLPGYVWAEPDFGSLVEQMKLAFAERNHSTRQEAARARAAEFSPAAIGKIITTRLHALELDASEAAVDPEFARYLGKSSTVSTPAACAALSPQRRDEITKLQHLPRLSIIVPVYNVRPEYLRQCVDSVRSQTYPFWELCLCDDSSSHQDTVAELDSYRGRDPRIKLRRLAANAGISGASNAAAEIATGEFLVLLDNDDVLAPDALMEIVRALNNDRSLDCLYTDEEKIDESGRLIDHFLKPDWSPEHLESVMYVLHMLVVRKRLFFELGGFRPIYDGAQDFDLMLRISRATGKIHHIQNILYQWRAIPGSAAAVVDAKPYALEAGFRALSEHVQIKYGNRARVESGLLPGTFRVRRPLSEDLPVTLLILTNNGKIDLPGRGPILLIDNFVDSILAKTSYRNYEIVVVDNSRLTPQQLERFANLKVRVENYTGQVVPFNYAAKANFAVRCARTEHIVLLNDDMEILEEGWLTALMEFAQDAHIGGVGARLLHADGTIQHVGMILGVNGGAAHAYHGFPGDFVGYNGFTHIIRNYSAVTGACFATRKSVVGQAGGFDEKLAIDYNDVDLCLRIVECGYRIVYTPFALLRHFESVSAKRVSQNPTEVELFVRRWGKYIENDPYYNVNLSKDRHDYARRS